MASSFLLDSQLFFSPGHIIKDSHTILLCLGSYKMDVIAGAILQKDLVKCLDQKEVIPAYNTKIILVLLT